MTHPTPAVATRASPLPCGGEGQGEGVSPRPTRRLLFCTPFLAALFLTTPTQAQIIPTGTPAADILLSQAITEHRTFLTCSALDPTTHQQITENWQRDTTAAAAILKTHNVPPEAIAAFTAAADPKALLPAEDMPWSEVKQFCDATPDWLKTYYEFNLTILELKLPGAFE